MKYAYPRQRELHLIKKKTRVENAETLTNTANDIISMKREFRQKKGQSCISTYFSMNVFDRKKATTPQKIRWVGVEGGVRSKLRSPPPTY